jgi:hypothetical protein
MICFGFQKNGNPILESLTSLPGWNPRGSQKVLPEQQIATIALLGTPYTPVLAQ